MAKALFGHVGTAPTSVSSTRCAACGPGSPTSRPQLVRLQSAHDELVASVTVDDDIRMLTLDDEPALT